jgi:Calcineurin-like phosphoesterase
MSDQSPPPATRLSDAEVSAFESLGLTPGHWAALAPAPLLFRRELRPAEESDFLVFRALGQSFFVGEVFRHREAEEFWSRYRIGQPPRTALGLLGWHLAHRVMRSDRENYLAALDIAVRNFVTDGFSPPQVSGLVSEAIETALGHPAYARYLTPLSVPPPEGEVPVKPIDSGSWKEMLVAPLAAALTERHVARGVASLPFAERSQLLEGIGEWMRKMIPTADAEQVARAAVDRIRAMIEEIIRETGAAAKQPAPADIPTPLLTPVAPSKQPPAAIPTPLHSPAPPALRVETARDFTTVSLAAALAQAKEVSVATIREWLTKPENASRFLFDNYREDRSVVAVVRDPAAVPKSLWIVGDLHADLLTLANIIAHAERIAAAESEPMAFVFLGDFVDRGRHDHETLLLLFRLIMKDPTRVCIIPGNHDVDLQWGEKQNRFGVTISPAEYCEGLNRMLQGEDPIDSDRIELAKLLIDFCKARPKSVILPDGTMLTHAGFPHTDLHDSLRGIADLSAKKCIDDFLWARVSEAPKKRPNRLGGRGHEFGWRDFAQFCRIMTDIVHVPVRQLIRGHDHIPARFHFPAEYAEYPVLTINAMGRRLDSEPLPTEGPHPFPVMARHEPGGLPLVVRLPLDPTEVEMAFRYEKPETGSPGKASDDGTGAPLDFVLGGPLVDVPPTPPAETHG